MKDERDRKKHDEFKPWVDPVLSETDIFEMELLLDAIARRFGYDFRQYSEDVLKRRLNLYRHECQAEYFSELIPNLLHQPGAMRHLLQCMSVTVTEFFRDPSFFKQFNQMVVPILRTYPFITFWCAGCATGEEAYSWAILLKEAGLLDRCRIYATDINEDALNEAKEGVYSQEHFEKACHNFDLTFGKKDSNFHDYCQQNYHAIKMSDNLQSYITFAQHNLVQDGVFGEMTVVSCRNVMIYFNRTLKQRCIDLFNASLTSQGYLCLGESEAIDYSELEHNFVTIDRHCRIYQTTTPAPDSNEDPLSLEDSGGSIR